MGVDLIWHFVFLTTLDFYMRLWQMIPPLLASLFLPCAHASEPCQVRCIRASLRDFDFERPNTPTPNTPDHPFNQLQQIKSPALPKSVDHVFASISPCPPSYVLALSVVCTFYRGAASYDSAELPDASLLTATMDNNSHHS